MKCPLCGLVFEEYDAHASCGRCGMHRQCGMVRCPNCKYEMPAERGKPKLMPERKEVPNETD